MARQQNSPPSRVVPDTYSREAGPAIAAIGSIVWKIISWASNVDFVLSLQSEKFGVIMQTFQDWGWILVLVGTVFWGLYEFKNTKNGEGAQERVFITAGTLISCIGVAFIFGVLLTVSSAASVPSVIVAWGPGATPKGPACLTELDTSHLKRYEGKFEIVGICGVTDPTTDMYTDPMITISKPFTITGGNIQIVAPMSQEMVQKLLPTAPATLSQNPLPSSKSQLPNTNLWYRAALIPRNLDMTNVKSLTDIKNAGGKVFDIAMWN